MELPYTVHLAKSNSMCIRLDGKYLTVEDVKKCKYFLQILGLIVFINNICYFPPHQWYCCCCCYAEVLPLILRCSNITIIIISLPHSLKTSRKKADSRFLVWGGVDCLQTICKYGKNSVQRCWCCFVEVSPLMLRFSNTIHPPPMFIPLPRNK